MTNAIASLLLVTSTARVLLEIIASANKNRVIYRTEMRLQIRVLNISIKAASIK